MTALRAIIPFICMISALVITSLASPVPMKDAKSTSEAEANGKLASLLTGVFVVTKVLVSVYYHIHWPA